MMLLHIPNIKTLGFVVSEEKIFFMFLPIKAYVKHVTPGRDHFWHQGHNLNKFGRGPLGADT